MPKSKAQSPVSPEDDIAGLFNRLGVAGHMGGYQDFSEASLVREAHATHRTLAGGQTPPELAVPEGMPPLPERQAIPDNASERFVEPATAAGTERVVTLHETAGGKTPLKDVFQRLLDAGSVEQATLEASPLGKLRMP